MVISQYLSETIYNKLVPLLEIALLGPPKINIDGKQVKTDRRKAIALLAYLAVTGESHPRAQLAALLWPDYEQDSAYAYLRRTLWELNQMLGKGWIDADRERAALTSMGELWLDVTVFQELIHTPEPSVEMLADADALYRGDFMDGFAVADTAPFEDWQFQQAEFFRREYANTLEKLVESLSQEGEYETALTHARRWLSLDQLNEFAHRAIMHLLAGIGDRAGAIRQYEACAQVLKTELGVDPQPETTALYEAILRGDIPEKQPLQGAISRIKPDQGEIKKPVLYLPVVPTTFIGRRTEVEQVKSLMTSADLRLITLTGPGGTGKTRLSIQSASEVGEAFPDGVFFAPLASLQSSDALVPAVAKAINFSFYGDEKRRQQLLDYLCGRQLLIILDNFEHLLDASSLLGDILIRAPDVKLVVTSRIRLNMQGEQLYPVGGMRTPDVAEIATWDDPEEQAKPFSAMQLFLERARRVKPGFSLSRGNAPSVMEICRLVQGMPLGLELAAAWVELLPPDEIAAEIARSLDFLETSQPDVPDRQRSLRAVFESSWKLLSKDEQDSFLGLSVFVGHFSREAAQQVSGAKLRTLLGLTNKSWLQQIDNGRFQLHELMRQYGEEQLKSDEPAWREANDRHAEYFADFVLQQTRRMQSPEQVAGLKAMAEEFDGNLRKAWDWLVSERRWNDIIETMLLGLYQFGDIRWQNDDLIPWFRSARLAIDPVLIPEERLSFAIFSTLEVNCEQEAQILDAGPIERLEDTWQMVKQYNLAEEMGFWFVILASLARDRNLDSDIDEMLDASIARLREQKMPWQLGVSLMYQANRLIFPANRTSDSAPSVQSLHEAARIFKELGVICEQAMAAELLGKHTYELRRPLSEVTSYYTQARQLYQQLRGVSSRTGINLVGLADICFRQGKYEEGFALFEDEQKEVERMGQMRTVEASLHWECLFASRYSTYEHALRLRERSLELTKQFGSQSDLAWRLFELGEVHRIFGEPEKAADLFEQAHPMFEKMNMILALGFEQRAWGDLALRNKEYSIAMAHYQQFDVYVREDNHNWGMAQSRARIALAYAYQGNLEQARLEMKDALVKTYAMREDDLALTTMLVEAVCLVKEGDMEAALELLGFVLHQPGTWNEARQHAYSIQELAARDLDAGVVEAAIERGKALDFDSVIADLT